MESPVVVDKPPEYHGTNERGFPFDEEEGSGAWSELAARHPDIAARLRQRPATWARKRRPASQDGTDDFGDTFGGFDRFPFDDIPTEFREHFPSHWNRRFNSRDEPQPPSQASPPPHPQPPQPQHHTAATQTEQEPPADQSEHTQIPQYGLRNTVDLGQKSPADPSLVDGEDRSQRSVSAPPDSRPASQPAMSQDHQDQPASNVRHIPIFVEGRDEPVINKSAHFGEPKPQYAPPPPQPHIDREQYFADDGPHGFHHPPNFSRAFGTPFNKGYRQGPQPFVQQKVYPQTAFTRGASPQRSQSPKPQAHPEEHFVKVPVHHEQPAAKPEPPSRSQQKPAQPPPQPTPQPPPQREATPPHPPQPSPNDPITLILSIQTDVLNLMTEVENFAGAKNDKNYLFLDEMLTRNLIKLDNVETDGKENIRQARKEAIKCIQKCIAVLEAKAESNSAKAANTSQPQQDEAVSGPGAPEAIENGEVEMKDAKDETKVEPQVQPDSQQPTEPQPAPTQLQGEVNDEQTPQADKTEVAPETKGAPQPQAADTRPNVTAEQPSEAKDTVNKPEENVDNKEPKKATKKAAKKRDKSKDKKETSDSNKDTTKEEIAGQLDEKKDEVMQVDEKGDKQEQGMEVDGAASQ